MTGGAASDASPPTQNALPEGSAVSERIMYKMGYEEGRGLGKSQQGITSAIEVRKVGVNQGIFIGDTFSAREQDQKPAANISTRVVAPSCVVVISNLLVKEEVYAGIEDSLRLEYVKYGQIRECFVLVSNDLSTAAEEQVRIFIEYHKQGNP
jgi:splicing factor 45